MLTGTNLQIRSLSRYNPSQGSQEQFSAKHPLICNLKCMQKGTQAHASECMCVCMCVCALFLIPLKLPHICQSHQLKSPGRSQPLPAAVYGWPPCCACHPPNLLYIRISAFKVKPTKLPEGFNNANFSFNILLYLLYSWGSCSTDIPSNPSQVVQWVGGKASNKIHKSWIQVL